MKCTDSEVAIMNTKTTVERTSGHYLFVLPRGWWGRYKESEQGLQTHEIQSVVSAAVAGKA